MNPWFCKRRLADNVNEFHPAFVAYKNLTSAELYFNNEDCVQWDVNKDYWTSFKIAHPAANNTTNGILALTPSISIFIVLLLVELALLI